MIAGLASPQTDLYSSLPIYHGSRVRRTRKQLSSMAMVSSGLHFPFLSSLSIVVPRFFCARTYKRILFFSFSFQCFACFVSRNLVLFLFVRSNSPGRLASQVEDRLESFVQTSRKSFWNLCRLLRVDPSARVRFFPQLPIVTFNSASRRVHEPRIPNVTTA